MLLTLDVTSRCRLACPKCARTHLGKDLKISDVSMEDIRKIADCESYDQILFSGNYGDCIYHPQFLEVVKTLKDAGKSITIDTNGSGKSDEWWDELFKLMDGSDIINFAMDGYGETVGVYRVNFKLKDFEQNKRTMVKAKKAGLNVFWAFIPFVFNEHQIADAARFCIKNNIKLLVKKSGNFLKNDELLPKNPKLVSRMSRSLREDDF